MTDSESDLSNPNVFTFQNANTTVSARGPNTNITNFSFRNNPMTSTMYMPRNFERQRYAESVSDQRSIYYRRETSPMSIHSACDIRPRNFQYYSGTGSHQSVYNGRSGSPVSMRSIDSSASVSAADIAFAFKNVKFNKYDLRVIKEAYNKLMKQRFRKRIEKRRNMRLFLKGSRRRSGDDSGEQGSDSSISSDDCRSTKTSYKENMSLCGSARMNLTDFRKTVRENNVFKDYSENLKHNNFKNMFSVNSSNNRSQNFNSSSISKQSNSYSIPTLKDRFKNGFILPSQRFNRSVASSVIHENSEKQPRNLGTKQNDHMNSGSSKPPENKNCESGSEEEIFSGVSFREKVPNNIQRESASKRGLESDDDSSLPDRKKSKIASPVKNSQSNRKVPSKVKNSNPVNNNIENTDNFEFAKPSLPVRKSKSKVQEKVIAKSKQPLTGFVEPMPNTIKQVEHIQVNNVETVQATVQEKPKDNISQDDTLESTQNSDLSLRPSFIKRKLFTQKLDVAEKANSSSDGLNSPQNVYSAIQKEKHKARKLVTSQSCLNREVQEDNNLLDLIHKIVPAEHMNLTNQTTINQTNNKTTDANNSNKKDDDDKWDVTSVISMCNEHDVSDTFTDEDIFGSENKSKGAKTSKKDSSNTAPEPSASTKTKPSDESNHEIQKECRIVVENMAFSQVIQKPGEKGNINLAKPNVTKPVAKLTAKTFWDTDFESDAECQLTTQKSFIKDANQTRGNIVPEAPSQEFKQPHAPIRSPVSKPHLQVPETSRWLNKTKNDSVLNSTLDSTRKFNISTLSVRSHRTMKKKKCCNEICFQEIASTKSVTNKKSTSKPETTSKSTSQPQKKNMNTTKPAEIEKTITDPESMNKPTPKSTGKSKTKSKGKSKTPSKSEGKGKTMSNSEVKKKTSTKSEVREKTTTKSEVREKTTSKSEAREKTTSKSEERGKTTSKCEERGRTTSSAEERGKTTSKSRERGKTTSKSQERGKTTSKSEERGKTISSAEEKGKTTSKSEERGKTISSAEEKEKTTSKSEEKGNITSKSEVNGKTTSKSDVKSKMSKPELNTTLTAGTSPKTSTLAKNKKNAENPIRTPTKNAKSKTIIQKVTRSTSRSRQKAKETKCNSDKQIQRAKNISIDICPKDRPIRSCRTPSQNRSIESSRSSRLFEISPLNIIPTGLIRKNKLTNKRIFS